MLFMPVWLALRLRTLSRSGVPVTSSLRHPLSLLLGAEERWVVVVGTFLSIPYFFSGYFFYLSITHTSVTANTAIFDSSFVFVFLFSIVLLRERISLLKIVSVVISFVGLLTVAWFGSQSIEEGIDQTAGGYIMVGMATILYALYEVAYKKYGTLPEDKMPTKDVQPSVRSSE